MDLKVLLSPLFHVDFDDLLQETGLVVLDEIEFGSFALATVIKSEDNTTIRFISQVPVITKELDDFIAFCTAILGPDIAGRGIITHSDHLMVDAKCFSRIWKGLLIKSYHNENLEEDELIIDIKINR